MPKIRFVEECTPLLTVSTCTHSWCASRWRSTGRVGARTAHLRTSTPTPPHHPYHPPFPPTFPGGRPPRPWQRRIGLNREIGRVEVRSPRYGCARWCTLGSDHPLQKKWISIKGCGTQRSRVVAHPSTDRA